MRQLRPLPGHVVPLLVLACFTACALAAPASAAHARPGRRAEARTMPFTLRSPAFAPHASIPREHTCQGADVSPPLAWSGAPAGTKSFALVVDDPDAPDPRAPRVDWVHWVVYDLPPSLASLPAHVTSAALPAGAREGRNDWKQPGWRGPCPPVGTHRYFFRLHALDTVLPDLRQPDRAGLERAMKGHVLASAELVGTFAQAR